MKIKEGVTVYSCDFCKKKLYVKIAMERHEKWCDCNPENKKACIGCKHCVREEVEYPKDVIGLGENFGVVFDVEMRIARAFKCNKLNKIMYPLKVERKGLVTKYPESFEGQQAMPTICEAYEWELDINIFD